MPRLLLAVVAVVALAPRASADPARPTFDDDVLPVFRQHCLNCHGNDKQKGDLNLATYAALQKGGAGGAVLTPGDPGKSRVYSLSAHLEEPKMPPSGNKMPDAQLALLKLWVEQGGRENSGSMVKVAPKTVDIGLKSVTKGRPPGPPPKLPTKPLSMPPHWKLPSRSDPQGPVPRGLVFSHSRAHARRRHDGRVRVRSFVRRSSS